MATETAQTATSTPQVNIVSTPVQTAAKGGDPFESMIGDILDKNLATPSPAPATTTQDKGTQDASEASTEKTTEIADKKTHEPEKTDATTTTSTDAKNTPDDTKIPDSVIKSMDGEPKTEVAKAEDVKTDIPKDFNAKSWKEAHSVFDKLKGQAETERKARLELEAKLKTLEETAGADVKSELEKMAKERDDLNNRLERVRLEESKEFRENFTNRIEALTSEVNGIAKQYEANGSTLIAEALNEPDTAKRRATLKEHMSGWDGLDQLQALEKIETLRQRTSERELVLSKAREANKMLENRGKEEREKRMTEIRKMSDKAFDAEFTALQEQLPMLKKIDSTDENSVAWNDQIESVQKLVKNIELNPQLLSDPKKRAQLFYRGISMPMVIGAYSARIKQLAEENTALNKRIEEYRGASPKISSTPSQPKEKKAASMEAFLSSKLGL